VGASAAVVQWVDGCECVRGGVCQWLPGADTVRLFASPAEFVQSVGAMQCRTTAAAEGRSGHVTERVGDADGDGRGLVVTKVQQRQHLFHRTLKCIEIAISVRAPLLKV